MDSFREWLDNAMGLSLTSEQLSFGHMAVRAVIIYIALILLVRLGKKRFLGGATAFDYILVIMIGAVAGRAMTGGSPYFASLFGILVLVLMHWIFSSISRRSVWFSHFIKGNATLLIKHGKVDLRELADSHMSMDDLREDLRAHGEADETGVKQAYLERSGKLSVLK